MLTELRVDHTRKVCPSAAWLTLPPDMIVVKPPSVGTVAPSTPVTSQAPLVQTIIGALRRKTTARSTRALAEARTPKPLSSMAPWNSGSAEVGFSAV